MAIDITGQFISELNPTEVNGTEVIVGEKEGNDVKVTTQQLKEFAQQGMARVSDVKTKTSELTNDANFVADASYVHTDNNFTNEEKQKLDSLQPGETYTAAEKNQLAKLWEKANPITLNIGVSKSLFEKGTTNTVTVSWVMKVGDTIVTPDNITINGVSVTSSTGKKEFTGVTTNTTYIVVATYDSNEVTKSTSVVFINNSYCGVVTDGFIINEVNVKGLTPILKNTKNQEVTLTLNNQKICYAYPASLGNLTKVLDGNGFECITGYTKSTCNINGESYNVYLKNTAVTINNYNQTFL